MSFRIVIPLNVSVVVAAEGSFEGHTAKKRSVGMSKSMAVFMTQGIPQGAPRSPYNPLKHLSDRDSRDVDISARSIPAPTVGDPAPTQIDINLRQLLIVKAVGFQLSLHVGNGSV
jgi:hypothetical protein